MSGAAARILINGKPRRSVPVTDRGLQYGDGLFETIAVVAGRPALWDRHLSRLRLGCERLLLPVPDLDLLAREALSLTEGVDRGILKITYTAGAGQRGYGRPNPLRPTRILQYSPAPAFPSEFWRSGIDIGYCALRLTAQGVLRGIKHLGRIEQVLARREIDGRGLTEGLMLTENGEVVEGTATNLFAVKDGRLLTPPIATAGVRGVMRDYMLELAIAAGLEVEEEVLDPLALDAADELFLTNSLIGLWPVRSLEQRRYSCGPVGRRLLSVLAMKGVCLCPNDVDFDA